MNSDLDFQDTRVPSFIPFDSDSPTKSKKGAKRKRKSQVEAKPVIKKTRRRLPKNGTLDAFITKEVNPVKPKENHIWVGAVVENEYGAYGVYFGKNDERNFSNIFTIEEELQNVDYGHVLGTLTAINSLEPTNNETFVVNVSCRGLPQAITNPNKKYHYKKLADEIRNEITNSKRDIHVRHFSARSNVDEHKLAIELASDALKKLNEVLKESKVTEQDITGDVVMGDTNVIETVVEDSIVGDIVVEGLVAENAIQEDTTKEDTTKEDTTKEDTTKEDTTQEDIVNEEPALEAVIDAVVAKDAIIEESILEEVTENVVVINDIAEDVVAKNHVSEDEAAVNVTTIVEGSTKIVTTETDTGDLVVKDNTIEEEVITNKITVTTIEETQLDNLNVREIESVSSSLNVREIESVSSSLNDTEVGTTVTDKDVECTLVEQEKKAETKEAPSWASVFGIRGLLDVLYSPFKSRKP